jgi:hypothetical protein
MTANNKTRLVKDYDKLPLELQGQIKMAYPQGFAGHLITYIDSKGKVVSALPFEVDDYYYLVRMTLEEAYDIVENDKDYDDDGILRDDFAIGEFEVEGEEEEEEPEDINDIPDDIPDEDDDSEDNM